MQDNSILQIPQNDTPTVKGNELTKATDKDLKLASFFDDAIQYKWKGKTLEQKANEAGFNLKYRRLRDKLDAYIESKKNGKTGLDTIVKKEREDKNETRATSPWVLQQLINVFVDYQHALRTYEKVHKLLRERSVAFRTFKYDYDEETKTNVKSVDQEYNISDGVLYQTNGTTTVFSTVFVAGEYITNDGEPLLIGSYQSVSSHLATLRTENQDMLHIQRFGVESYRLKMQHSIQRDYSDMLPNDLWSADNKKLDIIVIGWDWRTVFRPWLSGFLRVPTREYSFEVSHSPNAESVANSFVIAAQKWGLPKEINHDRGKDYLSDRLSKMWQALNINQIQSISKNARAKAIESFHNILDNKLKCEVGYTGNKYEQMPERTKLMLKKFTKAEKIFKNLEKQVYDEDWKITLNGNLEGRLKHSDNRFLHISELLGVLDEALKEYEETVHGGLEKDKLGKKVYNLRNKEEDIKELGLKLNTPSGRLAYHLKKGWQPTYAKNEVLSIFAMNTAVRVVSAVGINLRGKTYFSPKLMKYINRRVLVKFVGASDKYVYIFSSEEIENLKDDSAFRLANGFDIINQAEFVCIAQNEGPIAARGDSAYKAKIGEQRSEEKRLKQVSGYTKITGFEANIIPIQNQIEVIHQQQKPKTKFKDYFDE